MCNMNELEKGQGSFIVANVLSVYFSSTGMVARLHVDNLCLIF